MPNNNSVEKYPVPLIMKKIFHDNLSGRLTVSHNEFTREIYLSEGKLQYAASSMEEEKIGQILIKKGKLSPEQFQTYVKYQEKLKPKYHHRLGKLLVSNNLISKKELFSSLNEQTRGITASTFSMDTGDWVFKPFRSGAKMPEDLMFDIPLIDILVEATEQMEDFSYYKNRFFYRAPVTIPIEESIGPFVPDEHIRFYVKLAQCSHFSCEEILSIMDLPPRIFWQRLILLYLLNAVDFAEFRVNENLNEHVELLNELHERLKYKKIDHYQLLELKDTASVSEVKDKYFSFSRNHSPGAIQAAPGSVVEKQAEYVLEKAQQAYETLSDKKKKKEYDTGRHAIPDVVKKAVVKQEINKEPEREENQHDKQERAKALYLDAHTCYRGKKLQDAVRMLEEAIRLDPNRSNYYLLLGLSQTHIPSLRHEAEKNLQKVIQMEPWNADPLFYLGQLYYVEQLPQKAATYFKKALEINMNHTLAGKMLRKMSKQNSKKSLLSFLKTKI